MGNNNIQYKEYIESSPTALFVANPEGRYIFVNDAATKLLGYSKDELLNMAITDIIFEKNLEPTLKDFANVKDEGGINKEYTLKAKSGDGVDVQLNAKILDNGNVMAFCENISHLKDVERKLEKKIQELENINSIMTNRELKMVELKKKIEELESK